MNHLYLIFLFFVYTKIKKPVKIGKRKTAMKWRFSVEN